MATACITISIPSEIAEWFVNLPRNVNKSRIIRQHLKKIMKQIDNGEITLDDLPQR